MRNSETSVSEPLLKRRKKKSGDIETGSYAVVWEQSSGSLLIGWVVSGVKVA